MDKSDYENPIKKGYQPGEGTENTKPAPSGYQPKEEESKKEDIPPSRGSNVNK